MIEYLEAPKYLKLNEYKDKSIFLAGTITNSWDWQASISGHLMNNDFQVFNPRRNNYNTLISGVEKEQITWEFEHLKRARIVMFWFSFETLAPITLFELGTLIHKLDEKKVYIGIDPEYKRKSDILIQLGLYAPNFNRFFNNLPDLVNTIILENK